MANDPSSLMTASEIMKGFGALFTGIAAIVTAMTVALRQRKKPSAEAMTASDERKPTDGLERAAMKLRIVIYVFYGVCVAISLGYCAYFLWLDRPTKMFVVITILVFWIYWALIKEGSWYFDHYRIVRKILKERKNA